MLAPAEVGAVIVARCVGGANRLDAAACDILFASIARRAGLPKVVREQLGHTS